MSQADRDAEKWMAANAKWQERELYKAKETGDAYYIDRQGYVITEESPKHEAKIDELTAEDVIGIVFFGFFIVGWCLLCGF